MGDDSDDEVPTSSPGPRSKLQKSTSEGVSKRRADEDDAETLWGYLSRTLQEAFIASIPSDSIRQLPRKYMFIFGFVANVLLFGVFGYFTITGYDQGISQKFMSLTTSSGVCSPVTKSVTGGYVADQYGVWGGQAAYTYSRATYFMGLVDANLQPEDYTTIIEIVRAQLAVLGQAALYQDLTTNLLVWMSWQLSCDVNKYAVCQVFQGQTIALTADAKVSACRG